MNTSTTQPVGLEVKRLIKAPRERVFAAWTTPDDIMKWFGPASCHALSAQVDLRVGGEYRIRSMTDPYGELEVIGEFRVVTPPSKLVYTWKWKEAPMNAIGETLVTVDFSEVNGWTEVRLRHEGFPSAEARDQHTHGWTGCLDKLEKTFDATASGSGCAATNEFAWNELLSQDVAGSAAYYTKLFGWQTEKFGPNADYTLFKAGTSQVGGLMKMMNPSALSQWLAYVSVASCDLSVKSAKDLGGTICLEPTDIPTVGRIAVVTDPQGAMFGLFQPAKK